MPYPVRVVADVAEQGLLAQGPDNGFPGLFAAHADEGTAVSVYGAVWVHNVDGGQAEPFADLEVVWVVGRRDLEDAGAEAGVDVVVGEDLYLALDERHLHPATDQASVALVVGVDDEGRIPEHRLWTGREDLGVGLTIGASALTVDEGVAQAVELASDVLVVDFEVADRGPV